MTKLLAALAFVALNYYVYYYMAREAVVPQREPFSEIPLQLGDWSCSGRGTVDAEVWDELGATDLFICTFQRDAPTANVSVYVGYHATQIREEGGGSDENTIHPPAHCLPGSGWDIIDNRTVALDIAGLPQPNATAKRLIVARGEARRLVYYWYQSRGRVISEDWQKILYVGFDRATRGRTDGSLVRFMVPIKRGDVERAEEEFRSIAELVIPDLSKYVPI